MNTVIIGFLNGSEKTFNYDEMEESSDRILYQQINHMGHITNTLNVRKEHILYTEYIYKSHALKMEGV